jgi:hypothetical protein
VALGVEEPGECLPRIGVVVVRLAGGDLGREIAAVDAAFGRLWRWSVRSSQASPTAVRR